MRTVKEIFNDYEKKFNETIAIPRTCQDIEEFLEAIGGENVISNNEIFFENTDDGLVLKNTVIESNSAIVENTTRPVIENRVETNN